ncbi:MAG: hypothetical protein ABIK83_07790 [Candidatus Zixiibacteriota bacterium]
MYCYNGTVASLGRCKLESNSATDGAGLNVDSSSARLDTCRIYSGIAIGKGGGIFTEEADVDLNRCLIYWNHASVGGGCYSGENSVDSLVHVDICSNSASNTGGGVYCAAGTYLVAWKSILWDNLPDAADSSLTPVLTKYCDIQCLPGDLWPGDSNLNCDPLFRAPTQEDFHLEVGSCCIDAGDPSSASDPDGSRADVGAFYYRGGICCDADASDGVDIDDVVYLIAYIFSGGPEPIPVAVGDVDCSGGVDIDDVVYLINYIFTGGPWPCYWCK